MANVGLYLLNLSFDPIQVGAGSMTLALAVNAVTGTASGKATGTILAGTAHPPSFEAKVSGAVHATGFGQTVKVGGVSGEAIVSLPPPQIGSYLAHFSVSFALDANGTGKGTFSVGDHTYECDVNVLS